MKNYLYSILFLLLFNTFLPAARSDSQKEWRVGAVLCLQGACASLGDAALKGAELAAEKLNMQGGVLEHKVQIIAEDTNEAVSGANAVTAFQKLRVRDHVRYFLGPTWTPAGLALAPIAAKHPEVIIASPSIGIAGFNKAGSNLFNIRGSDELASRGLARFALEKGWSKAAVFSSEQPWDKAQADFFEDEFRKKGGTITTRQEPLPTATRLNTEALKIVSTAPQVVFLSNFSQLAIALKALQALDFKRPYLAAAVDETQIEEARPYFEGLIFANLALPTESFAGKYKKRYGVKIVESPAAIAYDALMLYARAIKAAGSFDTQKTAQQILKIQMNGASGYFSFDQYGGARRMPILRQVVGDGYQPVS